MDARTRWHQLEKEIATLEARAERDGEKALEVLKDAAHELARALSDFMTAHMEHSIGLLTSVRSLMCKQVRACQPGDSLMEAAQLMWNADCGAIPVVADGLVVGVITDRDVCMATYTQGKTPADLQVESAMSRELFSCAPDDSIGAALATMADKRVRRLPVLALDGKLVGIIALADLARWAGPLSNPAVDCTLMQTLAAISGHSPQKLHATAA
jgi:CBS domain-containing protein